MSMLKALGFLATGTVGILAVGIFLSSVLKTGTEWVFILALLIFVGAGATALVLKNM